MVPRWPAGVSSNQCMDLFTLMMVGPIEALDYSSKMPSDRKDCFLHFIEGGCADGTLLSGLRVCVPGLMEELKEMAQHPGVAVKTGHPTGTSWYNSGQLSKSSCVCRLNFGGEHGSRTRRNQPVNCDGLRSGQTFELVLMDAMRRNYPVGPEQARLLRQSLPRSLERHRSRTGSPDRFSQ